MFPGYPSGLPIMFSCLMSMGRLPTTPGLVSADMALWKGPRGPGAIPELPEHTPRGTQQIEQVHVSLVSRFSEEVTFSARPKTFFHQHAQCEQFYLAGSRRGNPGPCSLLLLPARGRTQSQNPSNLPGWTPGCPTGKR